MFFEPPESCTDQVSAQCLLNAESLVYFYRWRLALLMVWQPSNMVAAGQEVSGDTSTLEDRSVLDSLRV